MKHPLCALLLATDDEMWGNALTGRKAITIREGHRDYRVGAPVMLCNTELCFCVEADVVSVRHCTLGEVTDEELQADGFRDRDDLLAGMRQYYPQLTFESPVTVIRWDGVRGALKDAFDRIGCLP